MKTLILDDDGSVLYEQDDPGFVHLPYILYGRFDIDCDQDECPDPRCIERREEAERLLDEWVRCGQELGFLYHLGSPRHPSDDLSKFEKLPNSGEPAKVTLESYSHNELVFKSGERVRFQLPSVNIYSRAQVMFYIQEWEGSLFPWNEERETRRKQGPAALRS